MGKSLPSGTTLSPLGADDGVPLRVGDRLQAGDYLCTGTDQPYLIWQPNGGLRCCCLVPGEPARGGAARIGYDQAAAGRLLLVDSRRLVRARRSKLEVQSVAAASRRWVE